MAETTKRRGRPPKSQQLRLNEMEEEAIREIEDKAEAYADVRDERMKLNKDEIKLAAELLELMHQHKRTAYELADGRIVSIKEVEKVSVRRPKEDRNGDGDD